LVGTDGTLVRAMETQAYGPASDAVDRTGGFNLFESAVVGDVTGAGRPAVVKYVLSLGGVANLLVAGQNIPYNHLVGGWDAQTGVPLPAFPRVTDDFQFVSASTIAKVDPAGPAQQVLAQTGLGTLHAYDGLTGLDAPGFPKLTGGWLVAPAALAADGRLAAVTREGFLFEWATAAPPCAQTEWPAYRHDARGTGDLDADGTPPAAPLDVRLQPGAEPEVTFTTPGDDLGCGTATSYVVVVDGVRSVLAGEVAAAGTRVTRRLSLPAGTRELRLFAVDEAGNAGPAAVLSLRAARPSVPGGGLATTGGGLASVLLGCLLVAALLALRRSRHA
jgi:hypothetical protein